MNLLKASIFALLLILCTTSNAQELSFYEMKTLLNKNISDIEDILSNKDFALSSRDKTGECERYEYAMNKSKISNRAESFVNIFFCKTERTVTLVKNHSKHFAKIKEGAKKSGLKYITTDESNSDILVHKFGNNNYRMEIITTKSDSGNMLYIVSLTKQ